MSCLVEELELQLGVGPSVTAQADSGMQRISTLMFMQCSTGLKQRLNAAVSVSDKT